MKNKISHTVADEESKHLLRQDFQLLEKLAHQNREHIPERTVYAKGCGAYGKLTISEDISRFTCAKLLQPGVVTELFARFSMMSGETGAADAERDVRGFALKFYTSEGNWDLVGNNTPVFFIRDPMKFPEFIHAQKRQSETNLRSKTAMWDFWSHSPESLHQVTILMSDRGLPKSVRYMNGYGSHTYSFINEKSERCWVKFHFKTVQGHRYFTNDEAEAVVGVSRESTQEDLFECISKGDFPRWKMQVQIMSEVEAVETSYNPFDVTKVWPHADFPVIDVGFLELNHNPDNYFAEVEQAAFSPSNIVPGISWSPDKMLQARIFSYADAHRYRLGTHYEKFPVNSPRCPVVHHEENLFDAVSEKHEFNESSFKISGEAYRLDHRLGNDDFSQPRALYNLFRDDQKQRLFHNIAASMSGVPEFIVNRQLQLFARVHIDYAVGVRGALKTSSSEMRKREKTIKIHAEPTNLLF